MELDQGTYSNGAARSEGIFLSPASSIIPFLPSFLLLFLFLTLSYGFRLDWVLADRDLLRCRERLTLRTILLIVIF